MIGIHIRGSDKLMDTNMKITDFKIIFDVFKQEIQDVINTKYHDKDT